MEYFEIVPILVEHFFSDFASVAILGHIPLSFVEASPLSRRAFFLRLDIFTD